MPLLHAVVLALIQAATEFLPVSSTAHLVLVPWLAGWPEHSLAFDIALHMGTLLAVLAYFFKTWVRLLFLAFGKEVWKPEPGEVDHDLYENPRLFVYLVAATIPAGVAGLLLKDMVETTLRSPIIIGVMLIVVGLVLGWADRRPNLTRHLGDVSFRKAMAIGLAQAIALIPGTSRSGITISTAMTYGLTRASAARFSFLLSTPIILGASLKTALDVVQAGGLPAGQATAFAVGVVVAAIAGYAVIAFFIRYLQRATMRLFVVYRILLGILVIALALLANLGPGA